LSSRKREEEKVKKKKNELYIAVDVTLEAQEEKQKKTEKKEYRPTSLLQFFLFSVYSAIAYTSDIFFFDRFFYSSYTSTNKTHNIFFCVVTSK